MAASLALRRLTAVAMALLACCLTHALAEPVAAPRTLVLADSLAVRTTHSSFFNILEERGHKLIFRDTTEETHLQQHGVYRYDNLVLFAPTADDFAGSVSVKEVVRFIDSGRNVIIAGGLNVSNPIRQLVNECGVDFDEDQTSVQDHTNYIRSDVAGDHLSIYSSKWADDEVLVGKKPAGPVLFRGIGQVVNPKSPLIIKALRGEASALSHIANAGVRDYAQAVGEDVILVSAVQTRNNARVVISGSLDLFSNRFFVATVGDESSGKVSGNRDFASGVSAWAFQERGFLRAYNLTHNEVGSSELNPRSYRIKDDIEFSINIEEYDGTTRTWKPFKGDDVQLELVMMDPYIRTNLKHDGKGRYYQKFTVPDVFGVFKFRVLYQRGAYSDVDVEQQVSLRPFRHDEYERFLFAAYPYYTTAFSMVAGFFLFGLVFLYTK